MIRSTSHSLPCYGQADLHKLADLCSSPWGSDRRSGIGCAERSERVPRIHVHSDLWAAITMVLIGLPSGTVTVRADPAENTQGADLLVAEESLRRSHGSSLSLRCLHALGTDLWMVVAWGLRSLLKDVVTPDTTHEAPGRECLLLAKSMWDLLSNAKRDQPGYGVEMMPMNPNSDEAHGAWQAGVQARGIHENRTLALLLEHFGVRFGNVLQQLVSPGCVTEQKASEL